MRTLKDRSFVRRWLCTAFSDPQARVPSASAKPFRARLASARHTLLYSAALGTGQPKTRVAISAELSNSPASNIVKTSSSTLPSPRLIGPIQR
jgi:hypothetical protein